MFYYNQNLVLLNTVCAGNDLENDFCSNSYIDILSTVCVAVFIGPDSQTSML
jgi:hypothetical protein